MRRWISSSFAHYRPIISAQLLSLSIGFFCIIYLILSSFSQISNGSVIPKPLIQPTQVNALAKISAQFQKQRKPYAFGYYEKSFVCNRIRKKDGVRDTNVNTTLQDHVVNILGPYCDILPIPHNKWIAPKRYIESDIVFLIYTGSTFYHTRTTAVRDTWLSRVTHKYIFGEVAYPTLPIVVIENTQDDYASNLRKVYDGLEIAFKKHGETAKFYFLSGCDTFVNVPHLLKRLANFDHTQPLLIGGSPSNSKCYTKRKETQDTISYPSGGAGLLLSAQMMKLMVPKLKSYFAVDWPFADDKAHSDLALTCLGRSMGFQASIISGFFKYAPEQTYQYDAKGKPNVDFEPITFHHVHYLTMHVLDEFYVHQLLDRIGYAKNFDELMKFTRHFVMTHYEMLRIKRNECILPPIDRLK